MPVFVSGNNFTPAPEGVFQAVCVDVQDLGMVTVTFQGKSQTKHKIKLVWEIDSVMEDGRRFVVSKRYTASLHEKATLAKDLKAWRGRAFTGEELKRFDVETLIGVPCQVVVQHVEREGQVWANVVNILKPTFKKVNGQTVWEGIKPTGKYVRAKDRQPDQASPIGDVNDDDFPPDDGEPTESIPF